MTFNTNKVKEILLAGNYISSKDLAQAEIQSASRHVSLVDYLLSSRIITNDLLGQAIAEYFKVDYADLNSNPPEASQVLRTSSGCPSFILRACVSVFARLICYLSPVSLGL